MAARETVLLPTDTFFVHTLTKYQQGFDYYSCSLLFCWTLSKNDTARAVCKLSFREEEGHFSFCGEWPDRCFSVKWNESTCELIIAVFPGLFPWPHPLLPLASLNLSLPLSWNVTALSSKESEAAVCRTPLSELTCCRPKCHNFICAKFNNMARWSFNNVAIWFLSFQFLILLSQYANANSHSCKVWTIFEQAWRLWNTI